MVQGLSRRLLAAATGVILLATSVACSSSSSGGSPPPAGNSTDSATSSGTSGSTAVAQAAAKVNEYFANNTKPFQLPLVKDPTALRGKTVFYLTAGTSSPAGTAGLESLKLIQKLVGFKLVVFDGKFTASVYQEGIRQAVAQHADVLLLFGIDCAGNEAALQEVHNAGIKIVGLDSVDCNEFHPSAKSYFDASQLYDNGTGKPSHSGARWAAWGASQADYLISKLNGNAKVIQFIVTGCAVCAAAGQGFQSELAKCSTCKISEQVNVSFSDFGPALQQKTEQALVQHPEANAIELPYDDLVTLGVSAGIQSAGRAKNLTMIAGEGYTPAVVDMIRQDKGLDAGWATSTLWENYSAIDTTLRLLSGQQPVVDTIPIILYDKEHNLPPSGPYTAGVDFAAAFKKAWGLS